MITVVLNLESMSCQQKVCLLWMWAGLVFCVNEGSWKYNEAEPDDATDITGSNVRIGCFLLVSVVWHTFTLLCGVFAKDSGTMEDVYWCLRVCHCACYWWICQFIPYSFIVWFAVFYGSIFPPSLVWFVVCCVIIQYLLALFCLFELACDLHHNNFLSDWGRYWNWWTIPVLIDSLHVRVIIV